MEKGGEYQAGGMYQYYLYGAARGWLVYALYVPDYLKSYATAVSGAQRLGRSSLEDIGGHLDDLRYQTLLRGAAGAYASPAAEPAGDEDNRLGDGPKAYDKAGELTNTWFRFYGGSSRVTYGNEAGQKTLGMHVGWERLVQGGAPMEKDRWHFGVLIGQGSMKQTDVASNVKNDITNTYAGVYSVYQSEPDRPRSWYSSATVLYGRLKVGNSVPGELGYGLSQGYSGNMLAASLENGLTFRRPDGWFVEPQIQLLYTKVMQDAFVDNLGATVAVRRGDSLAGRLGLMALRNIEAKDGRQIKYWARASYQREFCGNNKVDVAGDEAVSGGGRNVYQLNVGVNVAINKNLSINGDVSRNFGDEHGYRGGLSLKSFL